MARIRLFQRLLARYSTKPNYISSSSFPLYKKAMKAYEDAQESAHNKQFDRSKQQIQEAIKSFEEVNGEYPALVGTLIKMIKFEEQLDEINSRDTSHAYERKNWLD